MSLASGTRFGPYEIVGLIGEGGMGEVYKARDTRLDCTVAIKVLPSELSADPERRARFEREARAIASLSHPHICALFDIGEAVPTPCPLPLVPVHSLVMEHLTGQTLADRLRKGPLPLAQALDIAAQIADALDAAHKHGIVHRDLKPGNVMLTTGGTGRSGVTTAKLLDFGLAKLTGHGERPALAGDATAPTMTAPVTARGEILGTLQYMAPEQLEGKDADARTDLWALGAMLCEMVTGRLAFEGESQVSLIGNIMNAEPPALATLQPLTPPSLDRVVKKCLAKHPDDRWDTAHDVADELRWIAQTSASGASAADQPRRPRFWLATGIAGGAAAVAMMGAVAGWLAGRSTPHRPLTVTRSLVDVLPADELYAYGANPVIVFTPGGSRTALAWTPDGQALVFVGRRRGVQQIHVRRLDASEARPLAGTEGAVLPAVSPDNQWVAFCAGGAIRKIPVTGGPAMNLASGLRVPPRGLAWDDGGRVYFSREEDGRIWQITTEGAPSAVTTLGEQDVAPLLPCPLPGGRVLLYTIRKRDWSWGDESIVAQTLATGERKILLRDAADVRYVPTGHLVFLRRGMLFAVRFDAERIEIQGPPVAVLDAVAQALTGASVALITGAGQFAIASTGTLAWIPGRAMPFQDRSVVTVDREGEVSQLPGGWRSYGASVRLAPGGRRLAMTIRSHDEAGVWLYDIDRGVLTVLARGGEANWPIWSPDGKQLAFAWLKDGQRSLAIQPPDGTSAPQPLLAGAIWPSSWSPDGQHLVGSRAGDIVVATVHGNRPGARPLFETPYTEQWPEFSPDGRWLAYGSNASRQDEVYVRPYPGPGPEVRVSLSGGESPAWHPNGKELFFLGPGSSANRRSMMSVGFEAGAPPAIGRPKTLFDFDPADLLLACYPLRCYDVAPDGQKFYGLQSRPVPPLPPVTHISLIQNWFEELKAKVPAR